MSATPSVMPPLGSRMPIFDLPRCEGGNYTRGDLTRTKASLIIFMCNHCPYVIHLASALADLERDYAPQGVSLVGINSNDTDLYPADRPDKMVLFAKEYGYEFPYLFDQSQNVAKAFKAACTPDFFLYDQTGCLFYRGQFDDSRPSGGTASGANVRSAIDALLGGAAAPTEQKSSLGCNIKWRPGNQPDYASSKY